MNILESLWTFANELLKIIRGSAGKTDAEIELEFRDAQKAYNLSVGDLEDRLRRTDIAADEKVKGV